MAPIRTVGVVSTGVIGSSFTALFLSHGLRVLVCSPSGSPDSEAKLSAYLARIWPTLAGASPPPTTTTTTNNNNNNNWTFVGRSLDGYYDQVDFIQECSPENLDLKRALIAQLDASARAEVIIASSSSGFAASSLVAAADPGPAGGGRGRPAVPVFKLRHPERVVVGHPFNPPHLMPLVEVVPHPQTDPAVSARAAEFYRSLGRTPIVVKKETPGFVANRLQAVLLREAFSLVLNGVVSAEEIDLCMTEGLGPRWALSGPFMTNVLGGGGTRDGFKHLISHIAPAATAWYADMDEKKIEVADMENINKLDVSVQEMLKDIDLESFQKQWGMSLVQLLRMKEGARASSV